MRGSKFVFESVDLFYYSIHKTRLRRGKSYIKSPKWFTDKILTIKTKKKKDDKCFQYSLIVALNHQNIERERYRFSITPKRLERNNKAIALNILFVPHYTKTIRFSYKSKFNCKCKNQIIFLMITDVKKWHYLVVISLSELLRGKTSNHNGGFYCLNSFHSYCTDTKLKKHENVCNEPDYCYPEMSTKDMKILECNHEENC